MLSKKLLNIYECKFALPDDFNGTLGEALMLLANHRLQAEKKSKIHKRNSKTEAYKELITNDNTRCYLKYGIFELSENNEWELIKSS